MEYYRRVDQVGASRGRASIEIRFIRAVNSKTRWDRMRNEEPRKGLVEDRLLEIHQD